jgi:thiamine biosynthesis lipoprotein
VWQRREVTAERQLKVMGSDAHLIVVGGPSGLVDEMVARIEQLEQRWSRFIPDSEVNALNGAAGEFVSVSADTVELVTRAQQAWQLSGGAFDPTVLGPLIRAGYDRSFDALGSSPSSGHSSLGMCAADIVVDGDQVRLPPGAGFDPGGIGKGLAADIVCAETRAGGAAGVCVNLGGDVRVSGTSPDSVSWTVGIEHPWQPTPIALLGLGDGAVATSTTLRRRWTVDGEVRHHLIDPQTGLPSDTDLGFASVVAAAGWIAEVLAKAVLLAGAAHPFDILGGTGAQGIAVGLDGVVQSTAGIAAFLGGLPLLDRVALQ